MSTISYASHNRQLIIPSTTDARLWWAAESRRCGSDWQSLGILVARVYWRLGLASSLAWVTS
jgi:hypothetical protein